MILILAASLFVAGGLVKRTGKLIWDVLGKTLGEDFVDELGKIFERWNFGRNFERAVLLGKLLRSKETLAMVVATTDRFVLEDAGFLCSEVQKEKFLWRICGESHQIAPGIST